MQSIRDFGDFSKVWLIGGTQDSVAIATSLVSNQIPFVVSVVTDSARQLYPPGVQVAIGCLDRDAMESFCKQEQIGAIIDASHPYAVVVSQQAIALAQNWQLPYLRYERVNCPQLPATNNPSLITELDSFETLVSHNYLQGHRVLLTVGCQALAFFTSWHNHSTLYARILPKPESLAMALAAGFTSDRLIALRPPITLALEKALWQQWQISLVVTKASGITGGEALKRQLAQELNIPLIVIARPTVIYPQQTSSLEAIIAFLGSSTGFM